jgi:hypothetical protein
MFFIKRQLEKLFRRRREALADPRWQLVRVDGRVVKPATPLWRKPAACSLCLRYL